MAQETKKNSHLRHQAISSTQGRTTRHNSGAKRPALAPICLPVDLPPKSWTQIAVK